MSSKKLPPWTSDEENEDLLYPWERFNDKGFENWWVDATQNPSHEVIRRPSLVRHASLEDVLAKTNMSKSLSSEAKTLHSKSSLPYEVEPCGYELQKHQRAYEIELQDDYLKHKFGLHRFLIIRDGNCMYRAFAQALVHDQSQHAVIRKEVVEFIKSNRKIFEDIIEGDFDDFVKEAGKENAWGSYVEILAVTRLLSINVVIVTGGCPSNPDVSVTCHHFNPHDEAITPKDTVWLSWLSDGHYDVILDSVVDNDLYEEWLLLQKNQLKTDAELAESLALEDDSAETGIWLDALETQSNTEKIDKKENHGNKSTSSVNSLEERISCHKKVGPITKDEKQEWDIAKDEELARSLQEEEDLAYYDQFV